jgi:hypothetical protein
LNRALELHDSELASLRPRAGAVVVALRPAYIHSSAGVAGVDSGEVHLQDVDIILPGAELPDPLPQEPVTISDGTARIGDRDFESCLPVPFSTVGTATLSLVLVSGQRLSIKGAGLELVRIGEPKFLERF